MSTPHTDIPEKAAAVAVEPTTPGPLPGIDSATNTRLDAIEVDLRGGYVRTGEHIAEDPDEYRDEQFVNVADLPSIIQAWASAALPIVLASRDSETADRLDQIARRLSDIAGPFAASAHPFASDVHGAIVSLRSVAASLRGEQ